MATGAVGLRARGASAADTTPQMVLNKSTSIIAEITRGWMSGILEMNQEGEIRISLLFSNLMLGRVYFGTFIPANASGNLMSQKRELLYS